MSHKNKKQSIPQKSPRHLFEVYVQKNQILFVGLTAILFWIGAT
jgi:hypothetical protein